MQRLKHVSGFLLTVLSLLSTNSVATAQKLPNEQEDAVWAATPVKIDGKHSGDNLKASNKNTQLSYTISNDDRNLYVVMKSDNNVNNSKIMMGGITVLLNAEGKKREKGSYSITYPVIAKPQRSGNSQRQSTGASASVGQRSQGSTSDSALLVRRRQQLAGYKEIKVFGFKDIADSLISIYNEYEISAAINYDNKGAFIYELAVPLKQLGLSTESKELAYNIKVNGRELSFTGNFQGAPMMGGGRSNNGGNQRNSGGRPSFDPSLYLPADFWAKYTLAKKQ